MEIVNETNDTNDLRTRLANVENGKVVKLTQKEAERVLSLIYTLTIQII